MQRRRIAITARYQGECSALMLTVPEDTGLLPRSLIVTALVNKAS